MKRIVVFPLLFTILFYCCSGKKLRATTESSDFKTKYVIIVVVDGPRYSETWGDPKHQFVHHMASDLAPQGAVFTAFRNTGPTYTNSGHTTLTTGYRQEINNTGEEFPKYPSIFQYYLKYIQKEPTSAWIITSKDKLAILANTKKHEWKNKYIPSFNCGNNGPGTGYRDDSITLHAAFRILKEYHPGLVLINFKEPDASAHAANWQGYLNGIRDTDEYVWQLWKFIQNDSVYRNKTAFFITNDHGRHLDGVKDGYVSHGCSCEGCRHINLFACGPDFKKNIIVSNKYSQQDVTATAAMILNLDMNFSEGRPINELFTNDQ